MSPVTGDLGPWFKALTKFEEEARRDLGIDQLGDRIRQLTGVATEDRLHALRDSARRAQERLEQLRRTERP